MNTNRHAVKQPLLNLMKDDNPQQAVKAVLNSGLLPEPQLQQWLDGLIERALRRVLGTPGCSEWTGRASWDAWAVKRLHSLDRSSQAFLKATERIIITTTREAQDKWDHSTGQMNPVIWSAAEVARLSLFPCSLALEVSKGVINVALNADVAIYGAVCLAPSAERKQQYDDLLFIINSLPDEA